MSYMCVNSLSGKIGMSGQYERSQTHYFTSLFRPLFTSFLVTCFSVGFPALLRRSFRIAEVDY